MQNFATNQKCPNFQPEMAYLGVFGIEFQNTIVTFETSTHKFVILEIVPRKVKLTKSGTKNALFGYFSPTTFKNSCQI